MAVDVPSATPGNVVISAVGLADPSDPRYARRQGTLQTTCAPIPSANSSKRHSSCCSTASRSRRITTCSRLACCRRAAISSTPWCAKASREIGKDGLMSMTTQAVVNVKAVQQFAERDVARRARRPHSRQRRPARSGAHHGARRRPSGRAAAAFADCREHPEGAHQVVRIQDVVRRGGAATAAARTSS